MREHKARQAIGERGLADALLADQHKSVRHAAAAVGGKECTFSTAVTEELAGYPRWCGFVDVGFVRTHEVASAKRTGAVAGRRRAFTACQMCFATVIFGCARVDDDAAPWLAGGEHQIGLAQPLMKFDCL